MLHNVIPFRAREAVTAKERAAYSAKIQKAIDTVDRLSDGQSEAVARAMSAALKDIRERILSVPAFETQFLARLDAEISDVMNRFRAEVSASLARTQAEAFMDGAQSVDEILKVRRVGLPMVAVDPITLRISAQLSAELIRGITENIRGMINAQVRLATVGAISPALTMRRIAAQLTPRKEGKRVVTPALRAERIVRTEVGRLFSIGTETRMQQIAAEKARLKGAGIKTFKVWITSIDSRTRDTHIAANGQRVPIDGKFTVGGEKLSFPRDPAGSAENTINCRCVHVVDAEIQEAA